MITTARKVRALGVLAMVVGACSSQVPTGTSLNPSSATQPVVPQAAPFRGQAEAPIADVQPATAQPADPQDVTDQRGGHKPNPNKGGKRPDGGKTPPKRTPSKPTPRPTPDNRYRDPGYRDPDYRYRDPDYRYYPPDNRYTEGVKITRTWVEKVGADTVTINWTTNVPTNGLVSWRKAEESSQSPLQTPADSYHSYTIQGLEPDTTYWYKVTVQTATGQSVTSPEMTVKTEAATAPAPAPDDGDAP